MARVFIDGFETRDEELWDQFYNASILSTAGLNLKGNYCLKGENGGYAKKSIPSNNCYYFAFLLRIPYRDSFFKLYHGGTQLIRLQFSNEYLKAVVGSSFYLDSSSLFTYSLNITYFMQIYIKIDNSVGRFYVLRDSVVSNDFTGDTQATAYSTIDNFRISEQAYIDNIIVDNSIMPEETEITILKPNGVGDLSEWNPSAGNNYACVDEVPYNDSDYVASGIVNAVDTYTLEDMPSNAKDVKCVQAQARARKDSDSTLTRFNFVMREGTTNYDSSTVSLSNSFDTYTSMYNDGPTGSSLWYIPNMNVMEIGVRTRT